MERHHEFVVADATGQTPARAELLTLRRDIRRIPASSADRVDVPVRWRTQRDHRDHLPSTQVDLVSS
jgi:hypothetical protein